MANFSLQEIADSINRNAFTRPRTASSRAVSNFLESVSQTASGSVKTKSLNESFSLISGMRNRLDMVIGNLATMLGISRLGAEVRSADKRDEYIGKLRSLSGGLDDIVDQTRWNGQRTLDGRGIDLSLSSNGLGVSFRRLQMESLYTSNEEGLGLTRQPASGKTGVFYDYYAAMRNKESGVTGLNITESVASPVSPKLNELETGTYRLEVSYAGSDSSVSIKNLNGGLINRVNNVDLSGSGHELVDLGVGVTLSMEKIQYMKSIDKYDFEENGPAKLYALMDYERIFRHELATDDQGGYTDREMQVTYQRRTTDGSGGALAFSDIRMSGIKPGTVGIASGNYSIQVNYRGTNSSIEVRDTQGRLAYLNHRLDLSASGETKIDTGKGLAFTINNQDFQGASGRMLAMVKYQAEGNNNADFDFRAYSNKIEQALRRVEQDVYTLSDIQEDIKRINQFRNGSFSQSSFSSTAAQIGMMINSNGGGAASSIFNASSANSALNAVAQEIFFNTAQAVSVQGEVLAARLSRAKSG